MIFAFGNRVEIRVLDNIQSCLFDDSVMVAPGGQWDVDISGCSEGFDELKSYSEGAGPGKSLDSTDLLKGIRMGGGGGGGVVNFRSVYLILKD